MKNQFNRQHRYNNSRSGRSAALQQITRFTNLDSSGPLGKLRGTPLQLAEKYQAGAKDAQTQGDVVLFQTCQQYADHYLRLQAQAIENEQAKSTPQETPVTENTSESEQDIPSEQTIDESLDTTKAKRPVARHKKPDDTLSMPMAALQEKSEQTE